MFLCCTAIKYLRRNGISFLVCMHVYGGSDNKTDSDSEAEHSQYNLVFQGGCSTKYLKTLAMKGYYSN